MILQALYEYALRKGDSLPEDGFEDVEIKYLIKIREDGSLVDLVSTEEIGKNGKPRFKEYKGIPQVKHTNAIKAHLLVDNFGYVLLDDKKRTAFVKELETAQKELPNNRGIQAVLKFYKENKDNGFDKIFISPIFTEKDIAKLSSVLITFKLITTDDLIVKDKEIIEYYRNTIHSETLDDNSGDTKTSVCLVTGEEGKIARTHVKLSGICEKQAPLVSFNKDAFSSYNKTQSYNAPVSIKANYGYTKALGYLINKSKNNKFRLGKDVIVFWAEKKEAEAFESAFSVFFSKDFDSDDPDRGILEVKNLFSSLYTGKLEEIDSNFYVLCLSPNAARISVRFWETGKVSKFANRIKQHFDDFEIVRPKEAPEYLNLYQILSSTALEHKMENVAPVLMGATIQSILKGLPYPTTLQQQCIRRIRAEQKVTRERAAILKAYINRLNRYKNREEEVSVSLDRNCKNKGYLLGRLFAVFEKIQQDTHPNLNATITDRFYGAASTNPVTVFAQLLKLNQHHLGSYENMGLRTVHEKEIGEIMNAIDSFPAHLDLNGQSQFAIGYYHEKQSFFTKNDKAEGEN